MKIPKKCPYCGSPDLETYTATETTRKFRDGRLLSEGTMPCQRNLWCLKCDSHLYPDLYDFNKHRYVKMESKKQYPNGYKHSDECKEAGK